MIPYLSNFEEVKMEANRLLSYSLREIRIMDEEYIINICCAFVAIAYKKLTEYAEKYFGGYSGEVYLFRNQYMIGRYGAVGIGLNRRVIFRKSESQILELLLHELTHSIQLNHKVEFWRYLQHTLYSERLITEEKPFRLEKRNSGYYDLYHGEKKVTEHVFYTQSEGYKWIHFIKSDCNDIDLDILKKEETLLQKLFKYNDLAEYRRANNSACLVDDDGNFIPMFPIWDKYIERYHLKSVLHLYFYWGNTSVGKKKNVININNYKPFIPKL